MYSTPSSSNDYTGCARKTAVLKLYTAFLIVGSRALGLSNSYCWFSLYTVCVSVCPEIWG